MQSNLNDNTGSWMSSPDWKQRAMFVSNLQEQKDNRSMNKQFQLQSQAEAQKASQTRDIARLESQDRRYAADRELDAARLNSRNNLDAIREKGRYDLDAARLSADASRYGADRQYQSNLVDAQSRRDAANIQAGATYAQIGSNERISAAEIAQAREKLGVDRELGMADIAQKYFGNVSNMFSASTSGNQQIYSNFLASARGF